MKLSLACNFDPALVDGIKGSLVYELYGKMSHDIVGGGRPSFVLPAVGKQKLKNYVALCIKNNLQFNYLLNTSCMGNTEYTKSGRKSIYKLLDFLSDCGVQAVTLNHPMLLKIIKEKYAFTVRVGIFSGVNTPHKARRWEGEGADCICLDDTQCNRDFQLLKEIRESVKCSIQLLVNNSCMYSCPFTITHMNMAAHASQKGGASSGYFYIDYLGIRCEMEKLKNPVNYIRATWIRPEDLIHYQNIGYNNFKIVDRSSSTETLLTRVKAYTQQRYQGNLADLIINKTHRKDSLVKYINAMQYFINPFIINPLRLFRIKRLLSTPATVLSNPVYINNENLTGFIDRFLEQSCRKTDCNKCLYCHQIAQQHVAIDHTYRQ
ncbi:MAG: peptidase U32, partial [Nitrospirae bacterium]|nr:peptidase U32 [Nitrospirota bacterium]